MNSVVLFLVSLVSASAFAPAGRAASNSLMMAEKSVALPFLEKPKNLDGTMVGDVGFDPLGFSDTIQNMRFVQAAEIKHGRVAMLATVGFLVQQSVHIPGELYQVDDPIEAISKVGLGVNLQILSGIGAIELVNWNRLYYGDEDPSNLGWGTKMLKDEKTTKEMKLKEIKNGRLAMIGFMGMIAGYAAQHGPVASYPDMTAPVAAVVEAVTK